MCENSSGTSAPVYMKGCVWLVLTKWVASVQGALFMIIYTLVKKKTRKNGYK